MADFSSGFQTRHPEHTSNSAKWQLVRDCVEGEDRIKAMGRTYLPQAVGMTDGRYKAYKRRAVFVNYVAQTLEGIHGMIFRRTPVLQYPDRMDAVIKNINREGSSLYQFFSDAVYDIMQTGFGGFLVDVPQASPDMSVYDAERRGIAPYVTYYKAEDIVNWKYSVIDGKKTLILVVLLEKVERESAGVYGHDLKDRYRVLCLDGGRYKQLVFDADEDGGSYSEAKEIPISANGKPMDYIPFIFAPENKPSKSMLLDIAHVNIGHYMKSADYENGVHLTEFPTGYVTGHAPEIDKATNEVIPIVLGKDSFLVFPEKDAKVGNLEFSGAGIEHSEHALEKAELQMVVLGSRIITPEKGVSETAESANIHRAGENAKLATFARNMSERATQILEIIRRWMNADGLVSVEFNTDYETMSFDANALNAMANIFNQGKMPLIVLYGMMMKGEFIPDPNMKYEDYIELLELEHSGLSFKEVNEAYKRYKETGASQVKNPLPAFPALGDLEKMNDGEAV